MFGSFTGGKLLGGYGYPFPNAAIFGGSVYDLDYTGVEIMPFRFSMWDLSVGSSRSNCARRGSGGIDVDTTRAPVDVSLLHLHLYHHDLKKRTADDYQIALGSDYLKAWSTRLACAELNSDEANCSHIHTHHSVS